MNKTYVTVAVLVLVVAGGLFLFGKSKKLEAPELNSMTSAKGNWDIKKNEGARTVDTTQSPVAGVVSSTGVREFTISGQNFSFSPNAITVKKGDKVKITFNNTAGFHDLKIDEFGAAVAQVKAPATEVLEFTADKAGSFQYYCSVGSHRAMGMFGTLTVTE